MSLLNLFDLKSLQNLLDLMNTHEEWEVPVRLLEGLWDEDLSVDRCIHDFQKRKGPSTFWCPLCGVQVQHLLSLNEEGEPPPQDDSP